MGKVTTLDYGQGAAAGSGMILTPDGEVLTNHHVIEGATSISVRVVATGTTYKADVVGYDATNDVAVLQLENASGLDTVSTDGTSTVKVGDTVVGVGNANGDGGSSSAAKGTVAAVDQSITVQSDSGGASEKLGHLIQVSADIISGDSGGPLYNADGKVIGMDTAASSGSADVSGFAIPIATALSIADRIEQGSAAEAGISPGSTITSLGGTATTTAESPSAAVAEQHPGDTVRVSWTDSSGAGHKATVRLGQGPVS